MNLSHTLFSQRASKQKQAEVGPDILLNILDDLIKKFPRNFEVSTNNGKYKFNKDLISILVPDIGDSVKNDKNTNNYHFNVDDEKNIMKRIEILFQGEPADFFNTEEKDIKKITSFFAPQVFPMKMSNHKNIGFFSCDSDDLFGKFPDKMTIGIDLTFLYSIIAAQQYFTFNIKTKSHEYKCSPFGACSSKVILAFLQSNPNATEFEFDFSDENSEFQAISQYFNGRKMEINPQNMNSLKQIAEQLEIQSIIKLVDSYITKYKYTIEKCAENQKLMDLYEELFDNLIDIKQKSASEIAQFLLQSNWVKSDYQELVACLLHVIRMDISIHPHIADLLVLLNDQISSENNISKLVSFLTSNLFKQFKLNYRIGSFLYHMYRKNIISIDSFIAKLSNDMSNLDQKQSHGKIPNSYIWFIPELLERQDVVGSFKEKMKLYLKEGFPWINDSSAAAFVKNKNNNDVDVDDDVDDFVEQIKILREDPSRNNPINQAIKIDDVDAFQSIVTTNGIDITNQKVNLTLFDDFNENISFIDYVAACGSIKCFKYLFLNDAPFSYTTLAYSIQGGNVEIVRILYQNKDRFHVDEKKNRNQFGFMLNSNNKPNQMLEVIKVAIEKHKYKIFDWLLDEANMTSDSDLLILFKLSVNNGNTHSMSELINKGFDITKFDSNAVFQIVNEICMHGYYKILKFLTSLISLSVLTDPAKGENKSPHDGSKNRNKITSCDSTLLKNAVSFGNFSIFELIFKEAGIKYSNCLFVTLIEAIESDQLNVVKYILDNNFYELAPLFKIKAIIASIKSKSKDITDYFFSKEIIVTTEILEAACSTQSIELVKLLTQKATKPMDLTAAFIKAVDPFSEDICRHFIELKVQLNYHQLFESFSNIIKINPQVIILLIENCSAEIKENVIRNSLHAALANKCKVVIDYLLKNGIDMKNLLPNACELSNLTIVKTILDYNHSPDFINQIGPKGTALFISVSNCKNDLVELLLQLPGIDPSISIDSHNTPLIKAVDKNNYEALNMLIEFYGDDIKNQGIQIQAALKKIIDKSSTANDKNNKNNGLIGHGLLTMTKNGKNPKDNEKNERLIFERLALISDIAPAYTSEDILLYAISRKDADLVGKLIALKSTNIKKRLENNDSYLHVAIDGEEITPIQKILINHPDIEINASNALSETPLTKASKFKNIELVDQIISHPKFDPKLSHIDQAFAYSIPSKELSRKFMQMKSLDVNSNEFNQEMTPLMLAIQSNDIELIEMIIHHPTFDQVKSKTKSCLFYSILYNNLNLFNYFLKMNGNDINIKNEQNMSLLHCAASVSDNDDILSEILKNENLDSNKSDIEAAFMNSKSQKAMEMLVAYDEKHENRITLEQIDLKIQLGYDIDLAHRNYGNDVNKAHQYLLRRKGIVPKIHPFCTSFVSNNVYQVCYICKTCNQKEICEICAKICHKGHEIIEKVCFSQNQRQLYNNHNSFMYHRKCQCSSNGHQCKCESAVVCEDDENIYDDLFEEKIESRYDYNNFDSNENDENDNSKDDDDDDGIENSDENHEFDDLRCTLDLAGFNPILQPLYHCRKCKVDICQNCAIKCHKGHSLNYKGMEPNSMCYCMNITDCKCTERKDVVCSYLFYGTDYIDQPWFNCNDCGTSHHRGCCASCIKHCHRGHDVYSDGFTDAFCDCGANDMILECKAMKYPPFNYLTCCTNRDQKYITQNQRMYHCLTCGITSNGQGICESCAIHCHIGHKVVFIGIKSFACECATMSFYRRKLNCTASLCPEMKNTGKCSRLNSDGNAAILAEFTCYTCDKEGKKRFCESCAVKCHKDHDVHFVQYSNFNCECETCQCMKLNE